MKKNPVVEFIEVKKIYGSGEVVNALDGINLKIYSGEYAAITGPSGSGKSTLMHVMGLLDLPTSGEVYFDGINTKGFSDEKLAKFRNEKIGFVFQQFNLLRRTSALDNVELPLVYRKAKDGRISRAKEQLVRVGLGDRLKHTPGMLSGGQQQRVAIARALVTNPSLLLADEPTGNLDSKSGNEIMDIFDELHKKGVTICLVTHEAEIAERAKRRIVLKDGKIVSDK